MKTIAIRVTDEELKEARELVARCFGAAPGYGVRDLAEDAFADWVKTLRRKANAADQKALARMGADPVNVLAFPWKGGAR